MYRILEDIKMQTDEMKRITDRMGKLFGTTIPKTEEILELGVFNTEKTMRDIAYKTSIDLDILRRIHENINKNISTLIDVFGVDIIHDMREKIRDMQDKIREISEQLPRQDMHKNAD